MAKDKVLKTLAKEKTQGIALRLKESDMKLVREKAKQYANGNISEWIRYASLNFVPTEKDLI